MRPALFPISILIASLVSTAVATAFLARSAGERDQARFENAVQATQDRIEGRLDAYLATLFGGMAFISASDKVTREEFRTYTQRLGLAERYPGIQGIGFSVYVPPEDKTSFEAVVRAADYPGFRIWPDEARSEYHTILYLEPWDERNKAAIGFDMFTEQTRRAAMSLARDTGRAALSGRVVLVQEIGVQKQPGFLIYVPVFQTGGPVETAAARRDALIGFVYGAFRADDLFAGIFGTETNPRVAFRVYDGPEATDEHLLHDSRTRQAVEGAETAPRFSMIRHMEVASRRWTVLFTSLPAFERTSQRALVPVFALAGLLVSGALFGIALMQARAGRRLETALEAQLQIQEALEAGREREAVARRQAEEAVLLRGEFLDVASHELKTPLTPLSLKLEQMKREARGTQPQHRARELSVRNLEIAEAQVWKLTNLVNTLLDVSRATRGDLPLQVEDVDLGELTRKAAVFFEPQARRAGCTLEVTVDGAVVGRWDPLRLEQVVTNLLSNAIKYGPGKPVRLHVQIDGPNARLQVKDEGIGIEPEALERIFQKFERAVSGRNYGGLGLGLYVTRQIVAAMGGTITAESRPQQGSTFTVVLPLNGSTER